MPTLTPLSEPWWRHKKWKPFPRYRPFVRRFHRSLVNSFHIGQSCGHWCFFDVGLHQPLNKQWNYRWFETTWRSCDVTVMTTACDFASEETFSIMFAMTSVSHGSVLTYRKETNQQLFSSETLAHGVYYLSGKVVDYQADMIHNRAQRWSTT